MSPQEIAMEAAWQTFLKRQPSYDTEVNKLIFQIGFCDGANYGIDFAEKAHASAVS